MGFFSKASQFLNYEVWRPSPSSSKWKKIGYATVKTIILTVRGYNQDDITTRANALTYSMLFALVPIFAMVVAIANGLGFAHLIEDWLNSIQFLKETNVVDTIMEFVNRYLETAHGGVFLSIGLLILLWTVYSFFRKIEAAFNEIWEVHRSRSILRQVITYLAILLLIPILIIVSTGMSVYLSTKLSAVLSDSPLLTEWIVKLAPFFFCWLMFAWLYWAVPNTKVGAAAAFIPGLIIGTLYQFLQMLSVYIVVLLSRTSIVYGTFAAVPLLLTWLQLSCLLILVGAELSYAIQNNEYFDYDSDMKTISRRYKDFLSIYLLQQIVKRFEVGEIPPTASELAQTNHIPIRLVNNLMSRLVETNVLREAETKDPNECAYVPAIDIHKLSVGHVMQQVEKQGTELFLKDSPEPMQQFWEKWTGLCAANTPLTQTLIKDL